MGPPNRFRPTRRIKSVTCVWKLPMLRQDGPQETQAGATNALSTTVAIGVRHHPGACEPGGGGTMRYYVRTVDRAGIK
jgi:hypothetical protein